MAKRTKKEPVQNNNELAKSLANIGLQLVNLAKGLSGSTATSDDSEEKDDIKVTEEVKVVNTKTGKKKVKFVNTGYKQNTNIKKDRNPRPRVKFDPANALKNSEIRYYDSPMEYEKGRRNASK